MDPCDVPMAGSSETPQLTESLGSVGVVRDLTPCQPHNTIHCRECIRIQGQSRSRQQPCGPALHAA